MANLLRCNQIRRLGRSVLKRSNLLSQPDLPFWTLGDNWKSSENTDLSNRQGSSQKQTPRDEGRVALPTLFHTSRHPKHVNGPGARPGDIDVGVIKRIGWLWRTQGPAAVAIGIRNRLWLARATSFSQFETYLRGSKGLEIGGPSSLFASQGIFPVYGIVGSLYNCNFSRNTVWEGRIEEGLTFSFHRKRRPGHQYICEATDLGSISTDTYDLVL